jgi:hypothetical protein
MRYTRWSPCFTPLKIRQFEMDTHLTLPQWACGEARALGFAPPACAGQGKAPQDRFVFIEQNDLAAASLVLEGGKFERAIGEGSGGRIESSGGAAVR